MNFFSQLEDINASLYLVKCDAVLNRSQHKQGDKQTVMTKCCNGICLFFILICVIWAPMLVRNFRALIVVCRNFYLVKFISLLGSHEDNARSRGEYPNYPKRKRKINIRFRTQWSILLLYVLFFYLYQNFLPFYYFMSLRVSLLIKRGHVLYTLRSFLMSKDLIDYHLLFPIKRFILPT